MWNLSDNKGRKKEHYQVLDWTSARLVQPPNGLFLTPFMMMLAMKAFASYRNVHTIPEVENSF